MPREKWVIIDTCSVVPPRHFDRAVRFVSRNHRITIGLRCSSAEGSATSGASRFIFDLVNVRMLCGPASHVIIRIYLHTHPDSSA